MNVFAPERQHDEPCPPPTASAKIRHLEFNDVRAGRLVAESLYASVMQATVYVEKALVRSRELWEVAVREVPLSIAGPHARQLVFAVLPRRVFDKELAGVLLPREVVDITVMPPTHEEEDDGVVQWFVEQHTAAALDAGADAEPAVVEEHDGEVMLTLRSRSASTRSWRGGGTMRQR